MAANAVNIRYNNGFLTEFKVLNATHLMLIAVGGAGGAVLRYLMVNVVSGLLGRDFPYGTLSVNILGSFLIGLLSMLCIQRFEMQLEWRLLLVVGVLGAFTTFSAFSIETLGLLQQADYTKALLNIVLSVTACIMATWLGVMLGRQMI